MPLDEMTRRNLELVESLRGGDSSSGSRGSDVSGTLLGVFDRTLTPMGARLLHRWLLAPLVERSAINERLDAVAAFVDDRDTIKRIDRLERQLMIRAGLITARIQLHLDKAED